MQYWHRWYQEIVQDTFWSCDYPANQISRSSAQIFLYYATGSDKRDSLSNERFWPVCMFPSNPEFNTDLHCGRMLQTSLCRTHYDSQRFKWPLTGLPQSHHSNIKLLMLVELSRTAHIHKASCNGKPKNGKWHKQPQDAHNRQRVLQKLASTRGMLAKISWYAFIDDSITCFRHSFIIGIETWLMKARHCESKVPEQLW